LNLKNPFRLKNISAASMNDMIDSDLDGVMDSQDQCPNERGCKANNGCIYYFEDFDINKDNWDVGDSPLVPSSISDGKYNIEYTGIGWWARWNTARLLELDAEKNFEIESRIKGIFLENGSEFGIRWSISPTETMPNGTVFNNSYLIFLKNNKQVYVRKYLYKEDKYIHILDRIDFASEDINRFQTIRLIKEGTTMSLYINDGFVSAFEFIEPMIRD
jgi:hypothetical protein